MPLLTILYYNYGVFFYNTHFKMKHKLYLYVENQGRSSRLPVEHYRCVPRSSVILFMFSARDEWNKTGNVHINLMLKRVRVNIFAVEKQYSSFITYSECVSETLVIQHPKHLCHIVLSMGPACLYHVFTHSFIMPDCWLEVSNRKVLRPATSTQVSLGFPVSISKC